jgi:hypothetical protein
MLNSYYRLQKGAIMTTRRRPLGNVATDPAKLAQLRILAAEVGLRQTRGAGAHVLGSLTQLLDVLADGYAAEPDTVRDFVQMLVDGRDQLVPRITP